MESTRSTRTREDAADSYRTKKKPSKRKPSKKKQSTSPETDTVLHISRAYDTASPAENGGSRATKTAWTSDEDESDVTEIPIDMQTSYRRQYCSGFTNIGYAQEVNQGEILGLDTHMVGVTKSIETGNARLQEWLNFQSEVDDNSQQCHYDIDERRRKLVEVINEHAQKLHDKVNASVEPRRRQTSSVIANLRNVTDNLQRYYAGRSKNNTVEDASSTEKQINQLCRDCAGFSKELPEWTPFELTTDNKTPQMIATCFGKLIGGASNTGWFSQANACIRQNVKVLPKPDFIGSFMVKTSKDQRECGIIDVALTSQNSVIVVDKHNRLVKKFDRNGLLESLVGRHLLKEPTRVTVISATDNILITDSASKSIKMFDKDGQYISELVSGLKYPSCISETPDGNIAMVEFSTKTVMVLDQGGKTLYNFGTEMLAPAFIGTSRSGNIVLSDWRNDVLKSFDLSGNQTFKCQDAGCGRGQLKQPQGVFGDCYGNLIVADKGNNRLLVFTEEGSLKECYSELDHKFKLPMAIVCNPHGLMVVAEYQGYVKMFRYLDAEEGTGVFGPSANKSKTHQHRLIKPKQVKLDSKSNKRAETGL